MRSFQFIEKVFEVISTFNEDFNNGYEELRFFINQFKNELSQVEIDTLLDVYISGIDYGKLKQDEATWIEEGSIYFSGNSSFDSNWRKKFDDGNYSYIGLKDFVETIRLKKEYEFALRVVTTTLRDKVSFAKEEEDKLKEIYSFILRRIAN